MVVTSGFANDTLSSIKVCEFLWKRWWRCHHCYPCRCTVSCLPGAHSSFRHRLKIGLILTWCDCVVLVLELYNCFALYWIPVSNRFLISLIQERPVIHMSLLIRVRFVSRYKPLAAMLTWRLLLNSGFRRPSWLFGFVVTFSCIAHGAWAAILAWLYLLSSGLRRPSWLFGHLARMS